MIFFAFILIKSAAFWSLRLISPDRRPKCPKELLPSLRTTTRDFRSSLRDPLLRQLHVYFFMLDSSFQLKLSCLGMVLEGHFRSTWSGYSCTVSNPSLWGRRTPTSQRSQVPVGIQVELDWTGWLTWTTPSQFPSPKVRNPLGASALQFFGPQGSSFPPGVTWSGSSCTVGEEYTNLPEFPSPSGNKDGVRLDWVIQVELD